MVKNSEQVHGIILVLLSQWAAGSTKEGKRGKMVHFLTSQSGALNQKGEVFTCQLWWWGHPCLCSTAPPQVWAFSCGRGRPDSDWTALPVRAPTWLDRLQRNTVQFRVFQHEALWWKGKHKKIRVDVISLCITFSSDKIKPQPRTQNNVCFL